MNRGAVFWVLLVAFQIVFGLIVFAFTRQYYLHGPDSLSATPPPPSTPANPHPLEWPDGSMESDIATFLNSTPGKTGATDPNALVREADAFFANAQYEQAAESYTRALAVGANNVNTYNSLGLTLHYIGRSSEALNVLNDGIAADPSYQRIWLTLGYVNGQLGNTEKAREALTKAVQMGADTDVGQSAAQMLEALP